MDCRDCKYLKRFHRMSGGKPYCICGHEKVDKLPVELFGLHICLADDKGDPKIKSHPRWCPLRTDKSKKGQYVAEWDEGKGKIALKYTEKKDGVGAAEDRLNKVDSGLKFLDDRYAVICRYKGYAICTLKVARPSEGDGLGYAIDDAKFEDQRFNHPEEAIAAIDKEYP